MPADPVLLDAPSRRRAGAGLRGLATSDVERSQRLRLMRSGALGSVHSWELVTAVDGPGTRLTVFLNGCPLRCQYCHNPDTWSMRDGGPVLASDLLGRVERYRGVFSATGGGLTLSGGEVLMQPAFAARILRGAKELGVHTCLDTSGYLGANATDEMLDDTDLVLLDIKAGDEDTYRRVTGRSLAPTLAFGRRLAERGVAVWVRFVLVPGLTDDPANVAAVADHAAAIEAVRPGTVQRVEVLPFHQMARDKWAELRRAYPLADTEPPTPEATETVREVFRSRGLTTY
ncbi:pyruvate formate-lyase-activating protein [Isoptericola chiayiensis]|uniref:Pyruvate formate-lyase-activating enzyme n=1 Tax=Isoptericola chiayiensis TaxID=579446 RepID=A0ABP8YGA9_9MICO|nr:pyruvate formate-lyase-activating protein [Isoptericola chiayiensis]NOW00134.1 pyruvate formate lyase activating enzyme [Isoptericola chiayiensis]